MFRQIAVGSLCVAVLALAAISMPAPGCAMLSHATVRGNSMSGIVEDGQTIRIDSGYYSCHEPAAGDVAALRHGGGVIIKSVRALPGDRLSFGYDESGAYLMLEAAALVTTTGERLHVTEPQKKLIETSLDAGRIPSGRYLVLGNGAADSIDSRQFGLITAERLRGKVVGLLAEKASLRND